LEFDDLFFDWLVLGVVLKADRDFVVPAVVEPLKSIRFQDLDTSEVKNALVGGFRKSRPSEVWASNTFDE
jgi:hypothetical protein